MLFNSYIFIFLFFPLTLIGYYILNYFKAYRVAMAWVTGMSLWFYSYFNTDYLWILVFSVVANYILTTVMHKTNQRIIRILLLIVGLTVNLGFLFYYKYYDFFLTNINQTFGTDFVLHHLILPLGISFFTFQQLSFVIDCYKGKAKQYSFLDYAAFVTFFPQLIAGPIVLHEELVPQFEDITKKKINYDNFVKGLYAFSLGLAKKVLIADTFARFASWGFTNYAGLDSTNTLLVMLCYNFQLYFDFSGYCDMALGIGYMFNVELPLNFNSPYKATSFKDFWDRWHLTLGRFFTQYVYIPLGGSRKGKVRSHINLFIVFLVSGFWHGANWTYFLWGVVNGTAVLLCRLFGKYFVKIPRVIKMVVTFGLVTLSMCLFRSNTIPDAGRMIGNLFEGQFGPVSDELCSMMNRLIESRLLCRFGLQGIVDAYPAFLLILFILLTLFAVWFMKNTQEKLAVFKPSVRKLLVFTCLMVWSVLSLSQISEFLYFNF